MTENPQEAPSIDKGDENPDSLVGEEVQPDHDLDIEAFEEVDEDVDADEYTEEDE